VVVRFDKELDRHLRERATRFGEVLATVLAKRGLSQYRLSLRANLGAETVNRVVRGRRPPTEAQVLRMGVALLMTTEQLSLMSSLLEAAEFDPLGTIEMTLEQQRGERRLLPRRRSA
jgi:transcriptional regulator with XRE-family HTH domain